MRGQGLVPARHQCPVGIRAARAARGKPISREDAMVASIARARSMTVVTRNVRDFKGIEGLELLNPWKA